MRHLSQYIAENRSFIDEYFNIIDDVNFDIIKESLKCSIIRDVMKQYDVLLDKWRDDKVLGNIYSTMGKPFSIRSMFTRYQYTWDKITDDMVQTFDPLSKEGTHTFKRLCSNRQNSIYGICIFESDTKDYYGVKLKYDGMIIHIYDTIRYCSLTNENYSQDFRPTEAVGLLTKCKKIHIIELPKELQTYNLRNDRNAAKYGMINPGDENQYKEIAAKNMRRYKELAAKLKIEREANDEIPTKVLETVQKVMDLSIDAAKTPMKYMGLEYEIQKLLELVGDKQTSSSYRGKTSTYGVNGIMYHFTLYLTSKMKVAKGTSHEYERNTLKSAKESILKTIENIDKKLKEIENKVNSNDSSK